MSVRPPLPGSTFYAQPNKTDVENKLTYQMLLQENKDLRTDIEVLRDINVRMGRELDKLHSHFQIKDNLDAHLTSQERGLYNALQNEPALFKYLPFLNPLFEAYDYKIKKFEEAFENSSTEFIVIERKYDELLQENSRLKQKLEEKTQQLVEFYRYRGPDKTHQLFSDVVNEQLSDKQELLARENTQLTSKFRELDSKAKQLADELKLKAERQQADTKALKDIERDFKAQSAELTTLKKSVNDLQAQNRQLESSKSQIQKSYDRSTIQIKALNEELAKLEAAFKQLRDETETKTPDARKSTESKKIETLQKELNYLRAQLKSNEGPKQVQNARREIQNLNKTLTSVKENLDAALLREKNLNTKMADFKEKISKIEGQNSILKSKQAQLSKSLTSITEKNKKDSDELIRSNQEKCRQIEAELQSQIDQKDDRIRSITDQLERTKAEKERAERELKLITLDQDRGSKNRDIPRQLEKLTEKLKNTEDIHKQTLQLIYAENQQLKIEIREATNIKNELDRRTEELRRMKMEFDRLKSQNQSMLKQKSSIIEEMKKIRATYQVALREKEQSFESKVRQIRALLQEAVNKQRSSREEVGEIARNYKKKVDDIKTIYEDRIRQLQGQVDMFKKRYLETPQTTTTHQQVVTVSKKVM